VFKLVAGCVRTAMVMTLLLIMVLSAGPVAYAAKPAGAKAHSSDVAAQKPKARSARLPSGKIPSRQTNLVVLGDSLGRGVWAGLYWAFRQNKNINVTRKTKPSTGFVRLDFYDWNANLAQILSRSRIDIAVIMVGANDRQTIVTGAGRFKPGSPRWLEIYASRVDTFIKKLKNQGARVYWVGLPVTRSKKFSRHMKILNALFAERARANKITFIDIWDDFTTAKGGYSAHGKDLKGRMRKLRANDGVHFTMRGYRKLSAAAERYIRADLNRDAKPAAAVQIAEKRLKPPQNPVISTVKSTVVIPVPQPAVKKTAAKVKDAPALPELRMMAVETIVPKAGVRPVFQPRVDYSAKNMQKTEKTGAGAVLRQALANDFQGILSIVQPDKPRVAARSAGVVRPVSVESDTPDDFVEYARKTTTGQDAFTGTSKLASAAPVSGLDFAAVTDARSIRTTIAYRTLLRGDAVSPKTGRGDDFSWPRD